VTSSAPPVGERGRWAYASAPRRWRANAGSLNEPACWWGGGHPTCVLSHATAVGGPLAVGEATLHRSLLRRGSSSRSAIAGPREQGGGLAARQASRLNPPAAPRRGQHKGPGVGRPPARRPLDGGDCRGMLPPDAWHDPPSRYGRRAGDPRRRSASPVGGHCGGDPSEGHTHTRSGGRGVEPYNVSSAPLAVVPLAFFPATPSRTGCCCYVPVRRAVRRRVCRWPPP